MSQADQELKAAVETGSIDAVKLCLAQTPRPSERGLLLAGAAAASRSHFDIVGLLLKHGAPTQSPLTTDVILYGGPEELQMLHDHGWDAAQINADLKEDYDMYRSPSRLTGTEDAQQLT
jgi:hypothetical protein